jgi:hypothetical protein
MYTQMSTADAAVVHDGICEDACTAIDAVMGRFGAAMDVATSAADMATLIAGQTIALAAIEARAAAQHARVDAATVETMGAGGTGVDVTVVQARVAEALPWRHGWAVAIVRPSNKYMQPYVTVRDSQTVAYGAVYVGTDDEIDWTIASMRRARVGGK